MTSPLSIDTDVDVTPELASKLTTLAQRKLDQLEDANRKLIEWRAHAQQDLQEIKERFVRRINKQINDLDDVINESFSRNADVISDLEMRLRQNTQELKEIKENLIQERQRLTQHYRRFEGILGPYGFSDLAFSGY